MVRQSSVRGVRRLAHVHRRVQKDFQSFLHLEVSGSVVLLAATVIALALANSPFAEGFSAFWEIELGFELGEFHLSQSLLHWIDDALMALFFFVVGLEIKREFIVGELSSPRQATLPIVAALGGMIVPAAVYIAFNSGGPGASGWGVPMATDIAFALGVLAVLGSRIPPTLKVFLTALAIADDIGAVLVIALFYTSQILWTWLGVAAILLLLLVFFNFLGVESPLPYFVVGALIWFSFLNSGVHATIAGVLVAFTIPARAQMAPSQFVEWARDKLEEILDQDVPGAHVLETDDQQLSAMEIQSEARFMQAPLQRLMHGLHPFTTYIVLPLFALANAGVMWPAGGLAVFREPVSLGIAAGLLVGKQAGILTAAWLVVKSGVASLPRGITWRHIWGASCLGAIGFTMSLFVAGLAFNDPALLAQAKASILVTSVAAGALGYAVLRRAPAASQAD